MKKKILVGCGIIAAAAIVTGVIALRNELDKLDFTFDFDGIEDIDI